MCIRLLGKIGAVRRPHGLLEPARRTSVGNADGKLCACNRFVIEVQDIEAAVRDLAAKGGRFRSDPIEGPGGRQVVCEDPSGNPIELFQARK